MREVGVSQLRPNFRPNVFSAHEISIVLTSSIELAMGYGFVKIEIV